MPSRPDLQLRSLVVATDIDTLPASAVVADRGEYVVVRSPSNPSHFWGNFLMYREPPSPGDRERWETAFEHEFGSDRASRHVAFTWDTIDGERGAAAEFETAGYACEGEVGLVAAPDELIDHPRANRDVEVRMLDPEGDEALWQAAIELQVENRDPGHTEADHRRFVEARLADRRDRFRRGEGAWFLALTPDGEAAASCGVIVTAGRGRFQSVDTVERFRRRGIATRLVHDVGRVAFERFGAEQLVIVAELGYHALPLYESLGFVARHRGAGVCWWPGAPNAAKHPRWGSLSPARADS